MDIARMTSVPINEIANIEVYYESKDGLKGHFTCTGDSGKLVPIIWRSHTKADLIANVTALCPDAVFDDSPYD